MDTPGKGIRIVTAACLLAAAAPAARAATLEGNPGNYREMLGRLKAGDTLKLTAGEYKGGLRIKKLAGEEGKPIVVAGPESGEQACFVASPRQNTVQLEGCSHLTLRDLKIDGRGLDGPMAVRLIGGGHHITLERLEVVGHGSHQALCGVFANSSDGSYYWDCTIRGCKFISPGTGLYLGHAKGKGGFVRGLIEGNLFLDPVGYCAQLKPQKSRPENVPEGQTIIRYNVFAKRKNASGGGTSGGGARPCLNINPLPRSGRGSNDVYLIYGNLFYQNYMSDALFQGNQNIAFYNNLLVNEIGSTDGANFKPHKLGEVRKLWVFNNTLVVKGRGISISKSSDKDLHVFGNAIFAARPLSLAPGAKESANLTGPYGKAAEFLSAPFAKIGELSLLPKPGKLTLAEAPDYSGVKGFKDWNLDFWGTERGAALYGALTANGKAPGRELELAPRLPAPAGQ
jgi:hypothetical protein